MTSSKKPKLSEKQRAKLREAINTLHEAHQILDNMNRIVDEIEQESSYK